MRIAVLLICLSMLPVLSWAADWPQWGGTPSRNMVSDEKELPAVINPGVRSLTTGQLDLTSAQNLKWVAKLGSQTFGTPVVAGGRIYVGTNNGANPDEKYTGDRNVLYCLDEATGKFLWQLATPKHWKGGLDEARLGNASSPTVEGDRVYVVTNRAEVYCLDADGLADGNDGPVTDEASILRGRSTDFTLSSTDADIVWRYDMVAEVDSYPHDAATSAVLILGDYLYVGTSNGMNDNMFMPSRQGYDAKAPSPEAPSLIVLDKKTGKLIAEDDAKIARRVTHGQWSSPAYGTIGGRELIILGGGDGICYAFDPTPTPPDESGKRYLRTVWQYDGNPPEKRAMPVEWHSQDGRNEFIATPVLYKDRVYIPVGQDPDHQAGVWGRLCCIDATGSGDISKTGRVWEYTGIKRCDATVAIADGLVYAADLDGKVHCVDAETGRPYWVYDLKEQIWTSPYVADGKVYAANDKGEFVVLQAGKELKVLCAVDFHSRIDTTPVAANGALYVATHANLFAFQLKQ